VNDYPPLSALGNRIIILGPSNSGKSTLAQALAHRLDVPPVHLDQFRHLPNTDWQARPDPEFHALHAEAIKADGWVMDGNYTKLLPARLARATGAIVLNSNRWPRLLRYFRRTLFEQQRAGHLDGGKERVKWLMIHWIMVVSVKSGERSRSLISQSGLPHAFCTSISELKALYRHWDLTPGPQGPND
jgi:adenylate kinase family enzyme